MQTENIRSDYRIESFPVTGATSRDHDRAGFARLVEVSLEIFLDHDGRIDLTVIHSVDAEGNVWANDVVLGDGIGRERAQMLAARGYTTGESYLAFTAAEVAAFRASQTEAAA